MCQLSPVTLHGDTIFCVTIENQPYTPAKPIVENLGISWQGQQAKLTANRERWGIKIILIPSESGDQQTLCIPVRKLHAFLASINPKKVRPELREKIELYQAECDDALWNYWVNGRAERSASALETLEERTRRMARERKRRQRERARLALPAAKQKALPPAPQPSYRAQCAEVTAQMLALRGQLFRVSQGVLEVFRHPFWGPEGTIPADKKPFANAMNYAIQSFYMAVNKDLEAMDLLFNAYVEGETLMK